MSSNPAAQPPCDITRVKPGDPLVQRLVTLDRKLFPKSEAWLDGLAEEAKRRNTLLLCAVRRTPADSGHSGPASTFRASVGSSCSSNSGAPAATVEVLGFAVCRVTGLNTHLSKLAVVPELRRRGIGRALVAAAVEDTARRRGGSLSLHVAECNAPARALYAAAGFLPDGVLEDYYAPGRHALKLRLELCGQ